MEVNVSIQAAGQNEVRSAGIMEENLAWWVVHQVCAAFVGMPAMVTSKESLKHVEGSPKMPEPSE